MSNTYLGTCGDCNKYAAVDCVTDQCHPCWEKKETRINSKSEDL